MPARVLNLVVDRRPRVARRDREPARARRPLPPVAHDRCARSSRGRTTLDARCDDRHRRRRPSRARSRSARERVELDDRRPQHLTQLDTIVDPLRRHRPGDAGVVAARARRGGRRAAPAGADRAARLRRTSPTSSAALRARRRAGRATPTSSTSPGCARRRGASGSPPRSTRRSWRARAAARSRGVTVRHRPDSRGRRRCCSAAGSPRGWAGSRARCRRRGGALRRARARAPRRTSRCALEPVEHERARPGRRRRSRPPPARRCRSTAARRPARVRRDARRQGARVDGPRRLARRGAASSARASARRCCATPPTSGARMRARRWSVVSVRDPSRGGPRAGGRRAAGRGRRGGGHIVLTGGSTPQAGLRAGGARASGLERRDLWFSDERCVPPDDEHSNYRMADRGAARRGCRGGARRSMRMQGELGPEAGAGAYEAQLREQLGDRAALGPRCCSGSGPDAHCASLFPGKPEVEERRRLRVGVRVAGMEPQVPRITLTLPGAQRRARDRLPRHRRDKAEAVARAFGDAARPERAGRARAPAAGELLVVLDAAAAGRSSKL